MDEDIVVMTTLIFCAIGGSEMLLRDIPIDRGVRDGNRSMAAGLRL
jgi:hypothetical protein